VVGKAEVTAPTDAKLADATPAASAPAPQVVEKPIQATLVPPVLAPTVAANPVNAATAPADPPPAPATAATPLPASPAAATDEWARWEVLADEIRMQVLQRIDIFTDTRLRDQLAAQLQPIVERASAEMVSTINTHVGGLLRAYIAEAIEREIEKWRSGASR
jgi:hypothetical protein